MISDPRLFVRLADRRLIQLTCVYALMIVASVALFLLIRSIGESHAAAGTAVAMPLAPPSAAKPAVHALPHVLGTLLAVIVVGRLFGFILARFGQPKVIGEMMAGIALGPSILGRISEDAMHMLQPDGIAPLLGIVSQLGVILYMFLVGLELNPGVLKSKAHASIAISHASILAPFLLGTALALWLHAGLAPPGIPFTSFALFMGIAMAITAFPVLARILADRGMEKSPLGIIAISCAAADDVTAWCLLALVAGISQSDLSGAAWTSIWAVGYIALVIFLAKRFRGHIAAVAGRETSPNLTTAILVAILASTLITESIGIHAIFGAFLIGAVIPHDSLISSDFRSKLNDLVTILLLPAFFAVTGLRTEIGLLENMQDWLTCGLITIVATLGKFGGTLFASRIAGLDWWTSASLGALMNTRGLMELVVLNIGLELGIISAKLFTMMVLMAIITTLATTPTLNWLARWQPPPTDA